MRRKAYQEKKKLLFEKEKMEMRGWSFGDLEIFVNSKKKKTKVHTTPACKSYKLEIENFIWNKK